MLSLGSNCCERITNTEGEFSMVMYILCKWTEDFNKDNSLSLSKWYFRGEARNIVTNIRVRDRKLGSGTNFEINVTLKNL